MDVSDAQYASLVEGFIDWNELLEDPAAIEASGLERVVAVGTGRTVSGVTIEFIALEVRELGSFGTLRVEISATSRSHDAFIAPEITALDEAGRRYSAMIVGSDGQSLGRGAAWWMRIRFSLVPPLQPDTHRLTIRVERLANQWPMRVATPEGSIDALSDPDWTDGPWEFQIPLKA